ncbi:MAG: hypothetical protein JW965_06375 [Bacteroidales bacterium]|nr:hypothetical protein [Bacteroidales bacterium]
MNKIQIRHIIDTAIIAWAIIWLYYLIFNWDVFTINLKTNLGFAIIGGYPFVFFFIIGLLFLILIKFINQAIAIRKLERGKDMVNKIALLEKDIEVMKLREAIYKMQSEELSRNSENLNALHQRLDEITSQIERERDQTLDPDSLNNREDKLSNNKK